MQNKVRFKLLLIAICADLMMGVILGVGVTLIQYHQGLTEEDTLLIEILSLSKIIRDFLQGYVTAKIVKCDEIKNALIVAGITFCISYLANNDMLVSLEELVWNINITIATVTFGAYLGQKSNEKKKPQIVESEDQNKE